MHLITKGCDIFEHHGDLGLEHLMDDQTIINGDQLARNPIGQCQHGVADLSRGGIDLPTHIARANELASDLSIFELGLLSLDVGECCTLLNKIEAVAGSNMSGSPTPEIIAIGN